MKKGMFLFWSLFVGIIVFALGVQFAYSQSTSYFATTTPTTGVSHTPSEIVCNGCVSGTNIADGSILDGDVSGGAGIHTRKINGANGWHFSTGEMPNVDEWYIATATDGTMLTDFTGSLVEITCDPLYPNFFLGNILTKSGYQPQGNYIFNQNIIRLDSSKIVYQSSGAYSGNAINSNYQKLLVTVNSNNMQSLKFMRQFNGVPPFEQQATNFECIIKLISKCPTGPGYQQTCGPNTFYPI
ncbi:hypothetical protein EXS72_03015 [Candidatus Pacearchaeota archaeon]|nr:hypothetical protein [Candidatus Pacearchaeota archaeon]